ncbi:UDP-N-acetylenolpyruvoylglucosamine reductase [bacterium HR15]|nr:UDP-N-acetylenolpyruvoylglucosamine reductase [bacterium HR15]
MIDWDALAQQLSPLCSRPLLRNEPMRRHTTLRVGGPATLFYRVSELDEFARISEWAQSHQVPTFIMGHGSNILVSDTGIHALVIYNACERAVIGKETYAETGIPIRELFLKAAQQGLSGLEFAVGIPGTLGGALVSNAGAYRQNIADLLIEIDLVSEGKRQRVSPDWMQFSYRDSRLRRPCAPPTALLAVRMCLKPDAKRAIFARARHLQRQRIEKQPPESSAGSFFKNVYDHALAQRLPGLPTPLREAGVVPAGFLIEACGLKGYQIGGACVSRKHANFLINRGDATASDFYQLAQKVKQAVHEQFGVWLEEEVLYVGWTTDMPQY